MLQSSPAPTQPQKGCSVASLAVRALQLGAGAEFTASFLTPIPVLLSQIHLLVAWIVIDMLNWGQALYRAANPSHPRVAAAAWGSAWQCMYDIEDEDGQRGLVLHPSSHQQIVSTALP